MEEDPDLECFQEEADTRLFFHYSKITSEQKISHARVKSSDTDVLIIFTSNLDPERGVCTVEFGVDSKKRTINSTELARKLGPALSKALIGIHSNTRNTCIARVP